MLTNKEIEAFTHEQRCAWLDGMSKDEREIAMTPVGYRFTMISAAFVKAALSKVKMTAAERLDHLEKLNGMVDAYFTEPALAAIQPASDTEIDIIGEALELDRGSDKPLLDASFELLTSWEVFNHLLALNRSLMESVRLCGYRGADRVAAAH
jgi:hypothetical protein